jgi:hypothetical protein
VSFAAMYAFLAVDAVAAVSSTVRRISEPATALAALALASLFAWWTLPAIVTQRTTISPPVQAMRYIAESVPSTATLYVHGSMGPFVTYFDPPQHRELWPDEGLFPTKPFGPGDVLVNEVTSAAAGAHNFTRARDRIWSIVRERYFEVTVVPPSSVLSFGEGWHGEEMWGESWWRWMGGRSVTMLPPIAGSARLSFAGEIPTELVPRKPTLEVKLNGKVVDRFVVADRYFKKNWIVTPRSDGVNELVLSMDKVINPAKEGINPDTRDLGLMLSSYGWEPASR